MERKPRKEAGHGILTGNAGEYYVVAELLRRGVVAALTPRNSRSFDVLATKGVRTVRIRVKTKTADAWIWNAKEDGTIFPDLDQDADFAILVDLEPAAPAYHVIPTRVLDSWLRADHEGWLARPGKSGRPHQPNRVRRLIPSRFENELNPYAKAWDSLWREKAQ